MSEAEMFEDSNNVTAFQAVISRLFHSKNPFLIIFIMCSLENCCSYKSMLSSNQRYVRLAPRVGPPQRDVLTTQTPPEETLSVSCLVMSLFLIMSHPLLLTCDGDLTDEPTSPSTDLQACNVPACSVVSSSQASTMATLTSTSVSPTLSSVSPFVRLRSQDCSESHSPTLNPERHYGLLDQYTVCLPVC